MRPDTTQAVNDIALIAGSLPAMWDSSKAMVEALIDVGEGFGGALVAIFSGDVDITTPGIAETTIKPATDALDSLTTALTAASAAYCVVSPELGKLFTAVAFAVDHQFNQVRPRSLLTTTLRCGHRGAVKRA